MEHTYSPKQFGKLIGKSVNTLQKWDRKGVLPALRSPTNRRYYTALRAYCLEPGVKVDEWVEDIGSALNYKRKGFNQVIEQIELGDVKRLVIGSQDRFVRFGYDWFEAFCERHGTEITVMNGEAFSPEEELVRDLLAIVTVFSARLPGLRSHNNAIRAAALGKDGKR